MSVYGLPELHREEIKSARIVGNPGCYPTGAILALAPLVKAGLVRTGQHRRGLALRRIRRGSNSGAAYHFPEANESICAYKVGVHRHTPEIEQEALRSWRGRRS